MPKLKKLLRVGKVFPVFGFGIPASGTGVVMNLWGDATPQAIDGVLENDWLLNNVLLLPKEIIATVVFLILLVAVMFFERRYLLKEIRPKMKCFFSQHDSGCYRPDLVTKIAKGVDGKFESFRADYYRITVNVEGVRSLEACSGNLIKIERNGKVVFEGEPIVLAFAPNNRPDSNIQEIREGVPQFLDFLMINELNKILLNPKDWVLPTVDWEEILGEIGEYVFTIVISSQASVSQTKKIKLDWNGNWKEVKLTDV